MTSSKLTSSWGPNSSTHAVTADSISLKLCPISCRRHFASCKSCGSRCGKSRSLRMMNGGRPGLTKWTLAFEGFLFSQSACGCVCLGSTTLRSANPYLGCTGGAAEVFAASCRGMGCACCIPGAASAFSEKCTHINGNQLCNGQDGTGRRIPLAGVWRSQSLFPN